VASGLQALTVLVVALLPGAFFVWGLERNAGRYGIGLRDRALRLVGTSAVFLALFASVLYWLYAKYWHSFASGDPLSPWLVVAPISYVAIPGTLGWAFGRQVRNGTHWARALAGPDRAPRAWDHLFQDRESGLVRCKMKSGSWVGGAYAEIDNQRPYASGYPEVQELYLTRSLEVDPEDGRFKYDANEQPIQGVGSLLMRWEEIELMEFIHSPKEDDSSESQERTSRRGRKSKARRL